MKQPSAKELWAFAEALNLRSLKREVPQWVAAKLAPGAVERLEVEAVAREARTI